MYYPPIVVFIAHHYPTILLQGGCVHHKEESGGVAGDFLGSGGGGKIFSNWSDTRIPAAANTVMASDTRRRVFAGRTIGNTLDSTCLKTVIDSLYSPAQDSNIDRSWTGFFRNMNSGSWGFDDSFDDCCCCCFLGLDCDMMGRRGGGSGGDWGGAKRHCARIARAGDRRRAFRSRSRRASVSHSLNLTRVRRTRSEIVNELSGDVYRSGMPSRALAPPALTSHTYRLSTSARSPTSRTTRAGARSPSRTRRRSWATATLETRLPSMARA